MTLNHKSPVPLFEQLKEQIRLRVLAGSLGPGDPVPSIRQLAVQLTVNPNTIAKVYRELELEGVLENRPGKGCFVTSTGRSEDDLRREREERVRREVREAVVRWRALGFDPGEIARFIEETNHE
ncbi:MAG: GntR family transcriptional regulator [Acidobacteria bacterium]|nr:GntR family transcriptional regulator [Acidobacteriota bacterium]